MGPTREAARMVQRATTDYVRTTIDRTQSRSVVMTAGGVAASEHPLASQAGASMLARGGHAVDAAIAANAVMGVVAPMMNGIGGDLFAIVYDAATVNCTASTPAAGRRPAAYDRSPARQGITTMPQTGIHSVTVPGAVAGWMALHESFGKRPLADVLSAAIGARRTGLPGLGDHRGGMARQHDAPAGDRANRRASTCRMAGHRESGRCSATRTWRCTTRMIAADGGDAFYRGAIAQRILELLGASRRRPHRRQTCRGLRRRVGDAAHDHVSRVDGVRDTAEQPGHRRADDAQHPRACSRSAEYGHNSAETLHTLIEAKKLAYADMQRYVGDPRFHNVPVEAMLSKAYAAQRAARSNPRTPIPKLRLARCRRTAATRPICASSTQPATSSRSFRATSPTSDPASCPTARASRCRAAAGCSRSIASHPNALAPRKRPLQTMIPGVHGRARNPARRRRCAFGVMGGWNQSQAHVQVISNIVDHGMNIQAGARSPALRRS